MKVKRLFAISYGHFAIDILNSSIAMILTAVSGVYNLSVSQIGMGAMIYTFAAALTQPLFGIVADRLKGRWLGAIGLFWVMIFYALAPFMPNYPAFIICLSIGALGSGAFHPVGMVNASEAGGQYPTTATSIFFLLGQSGLALGPILSGIILQRIGLAGLPYLALAMTPAVIFMAMYLHSAVDVDHHHGDAAAQDANTPVPQAGADEAKQDRQEQVVARNQTVRRGVYVAVAFTLLVALRATTLQSFSTLLPKYFDEIGFNSAQYGLMIGIFSFAGAIGTFVGGYLGDHFNRRLIIFVSQLAGVPFAYMMIHVQGWGYFVAAISAGILLGMPHSILIIMAQRLLPTRKGMIGGAVLGFMFASGAVTAWIASEFADIYGLSAVLTFLAFVPLAAGACALVLPSTRGMTAVAVPTPATVSTPATPSAAAD